MSKKTTEKSNIERQQPLKDSKDPRVNYDNTRRSKFLKDTAKGSNVHRGQSSKSQAQTFRGQGKMQWLPNKHGLDFKNSDNDKSWYTRNRELADSAGRLGFSKTTGMPDGNDVITPGVMALYWESAMDLGSSFPINQAANALYSNIVHANSRNTSYTSQDLMMMILAAREIFAGLAIGIRAYGLMLKTNQENFYCPAELIRASGFDYDDLRSNYSHMQDDINNLIADAKQLWIPNDLPVLHRAFWMGTNVYMDSENDKGQYYLYVPATLKIFDATGDKQGGRVTVPYNTAPNGSDPNIWNPLGAQKSQTYRVEQSWATYVSSISRLIQALISNEYRGVIFGDILKAYGSENLFKLNFISSDYEVTPVYNREVLSQIENATFSACAAPNVGLSMQNVGINFIQDQHFGTIAGAFAVANNPDPRFVPQAARTFYPERPILNFHFKGQPSPDDILVASRLTSCGNVAAFGPDINDPEGMYAIVPRYMGTERVVMMLISEYAYDPTTATYTSTVSRHGSIIAEDEAGAISRLCLRSQFDWTPFAYLSTMNIPNPLTTLGSYTVNNYFGDVDNYIVLEPSELQRLHHCAIMSEFGVPILK